MELLTFHSRLDENVEDIILIDCHLLIDFKKILMKKRIVFNKISVQIFDEFDTRRFD